MVLSITSVVDGSYLEGGGTPSENELDKEYPDAEPKRSVEGLNRFGMQKGELYSAQDQQNADYLQMMRMLKFCQFLTSQRRLAISLEYMMAVQLFPHLGCIRSHTRPLVSVQKAMGWLQRSSWRTSRRTRSWMKMNLR